MPAAGCSLSCCASVNRDLKSSLVARRPDQGHHRHMRNGAAITVEMATAALAAVVAAVVAAAVAAAVAVAATATATAKEPLETSIFTWRHR